MNNETMNSGDAESLISNPRSPITNYQLLFIVGPTAVGKSSLAIELAERINGEIISADSRYLYRGMDIGTAKPSLADRARVPHHLIDVADPDHPWSLAEYVQACKQLISEINERKNLPLVVGGTGQYVRALLEGWSMPERAEDSSLRAELQVVADRDGVDALYEKLLNADPVSASKIDKRNVRRVIRALEVITITGRPFSDQRKKSQPDFDYKIVGLTLPREKLYARIDARVDSMMTNGLVDEMRALLAKGYDWHLPALSAIGYKQIGMSLRGECDLDEAVRLIKHDTRRFVRQQYNWFRLNDPKIKWWDAEGVKVEEVVGWLDG
ncbi:MAG: tRNA (adenosine(37)-N6)-dimethylallyltransferase MiaA [Chloroflexi bacterium]|nr:tRNA (adenosine(37)-N6)-dimethylallyltransferase MiaA [Chloroflexota bacterium]